MQASDEAERQDEGSSDGLGSRLRQARERQDLSLEAVSAELRIEVPMLRALEEERFDALGAPVFARGFLKQYGARLGLDTAELIDLYERESDEVRFDLAPSKTIRLRDDRQVTFWVIAGLALVTAAAVLAVWWWLGSESADNLISDSATSSTIEPDTGSGVGAGAPVAVPVQDSVAVERQPVSGSQSSEPAAVRPAEALVETPAITDPAGTEPTPAEPTPADDVSAETVIDSGSGIGADTVPTGPELRVVFNEDSWAEISDESGERLFYALGRAGSDAVIPADGALSLFFGNAGGVEISFGGEPVEIPASARRGNLAQFSFDPEAGRAR